MPTTDPTEPTVIPVSTDAAAFLWQMHGYNQGRFNDLERQVKSTHADVLGCVLLLGALWGLILYQQQTKTKGAEHGTV